MLVTLNGETREVPADATVTGALELIGVPADGRGLAVAVDGVVVPRGTWERTELSDGAKIEVVVAVQGG